MKPKTKIIILECTTTLTNAALAEAIRFAIQGCCTAEQLTLTQKPRVQTVQAPRKE